MLQNDSKLTVIENLSKAPDLPAENREVLRQNGLLAKSASIHFLKSRCLSSYCLHAVRYENEVGQLRSGICFVDHDERGEWRLRNTVYDGEKNHPAKEERETSQPWVLLSGALQGNPFWVGGPVIDHGFNVTRVLLIGANGIILEDAVEENLVLFLTEKQIGLPIEAELYDHTHTRVAKYTIFPAFS